MVLLFSHTMYQSSCNQATNSWCCIHALIKIILWRGVAFETYSWHKLLISREARVIQNRGDKQKMESVNRCPGCHGNDIQIFSDGYNDGDMWFHCHTCGSEDCVDHEDMAEYFRAKVRLPTKSPPFKDHQPIPRNHGWPGRMVPSDIRKWMEKNNVKLGAGGDKW